MAKLKAYSPQHIKTWSYFNLPWMNSIAWLMTSSKNISLKPRHISSKKRYVFTLNHQGAFDFLAVFYGLPFNIHQKLAPYRFFVANRFFRFPIFRWAMLSFGCFPAKQHKRYKYGIPAAKDAINRAETVVIFPEGKVSNIDRKYRPKKGVEALANTPDVMLIPVRVKLNRQKGLFKGYSLVVGKPFDGKNMSAEQIMDVVYDLKFR